MKNSNMPHLLVELLSSEVAVPPSLSLNINQYVTLKEITDKVKSIFPILRAHDLIPFEAYGIDEHQLKHPSRCPDWNCMDKDACPFVSVASDLFIVNRGDQTASPVLVLATKEKESLLVKSSL